MPHPRRSPLRGLQPRVWALAILLSVGAGHALAASKVLVAAIGDPAPGGGLFAGPSFTGWPTAAGTGWIAFRGQVSQGGTSEALIVAHRTPPITRFQVASVGQTAPGGGTFKAFIGRPAVNAAGHVVFLATLTNPDNVDDANAPTPAGIFLYRNGELTIVALAGDTISGAGRIDLTASIGQTVEVDDPFPERSPSLNDADDVAFLAAIRDNASVPGALFVATADAPPAVVVKIGDPYDGGAFTAFGPPAINNFRALAFHARATTTDSTDDDGVIDGIFRFDAGVSVIVRDGMAMGSAPPLAGFADPVAFNDHGDVAFVAGPLFDDDSGADDERFGIVVCRSGIVTAVAGAGKVVDADDVVGIRLGAAAGSQLTAPALAPDGSVAFFARVRNTHGALGEVIALWNPTKGSAVAVAHTSGPDASTTPAGGTYSGSESAPAVDALGGVVFLSRIVGGSSSEAVVYQPETGVGVPVVVGDAAPSGGFFAGTPFSNPLLNDQGDVVFRAFVARSEVSVGIFRYRDGNLEPLVRGGDHAPVGEATTFDDLLGQPGLAADGSVVFAAHVTDHGVGIFVVDANGVRRIAASGDPVPGESNTTFRSFALNPSINDDGAVAFRSTTLLKTDAGSERQESIFLADASGMRRIVSVGDMAPVGLPFLRLRDPVLSAVPTIAFRASVGEEREAASGLFLGDTNGVLKVAIEKDDLGGGVTLSGFTGDPALNSNGDLAFLVTRSRLIGQNLRRALGPAILRSSTSTLDAVVAQDMPGPAGGTFRTLGQPAINSLGHLAFRGSFLPFTGGTAGLFLETDDELEPYLALGEATPLKGRISQISSRPSLNADDDVAFTAAISGGTSRSGIFLASRTTVSLPMLAVRVGRRGRDRVKVRMLLRTGQNSTGLDPAREAVTLTLADAKGSLWTVTVPAGQLKRHGKALAVVPKRGSTLALAVKSVRVEQPQRDTVRALVQSAALDLTARGQRPLEAPFTVTLQVGDDSGSKIAPCDVGKHGVHCKVL